MMEEDQGEEDVNNGKRSRSSSKSDSQNNDNTKRARLEDVEEIAANIAEVMGEGEDEDKAVASQAMSELSQDPSQQLMASQSSQHTVASQLSAKTNATLSTLDMSSIFSLSKGRGVANPSLEYITDVVNIMRSNAIGNVKNTLKNTKHFIQGTLKYLWKNKNKLIEGTKIDTTTIVDSLNSEYQQLKDLMDADDAIHSSNRKQQAKEKLLEKFNGLKETIIFLNKSDIITDQIKLKSIRGIINVFLKHKIFEKAFISIEEHGEEKTRDLTVKLNVLIFTIMDSTYSTEANLREAIKGLKDSLKPFVRRQEIMDLAQPQQGRSRANSMPGGKTKRNKMTKNRRTKKRKY
jgi:hypothetical protein